MKITDTTIYSDDMKATADQAFQSIILDSGAFKDPPGPLKGVLREVFIAAFMAGAAHVKDVRFVEATMNLPEAKP